MPDVEITEFEEIDPDGLHLVGKGANGFPALLAKAVQDEVDAVIADAQPVTEVDAAQKAADEAQARMEANLAAKADQVNCPTCDGKGKIKGGKVKCPDCGGDGKVSADKADDMGKAQTVDESMIRDAITKAKYNAADLKAMADKGQAMKNDNGDPSYPIADAQDLDNAIHAVGRGGADHDAIRKHIMARAAALKLSAKIPDNWNADGSMGKSEAEADDVEKDANLPDTGTIPTPGSPAWEAEDAQCASDAANLLLQAAALIQQFSDREGVEVAVGEGNDLFDQYDAQMALQAVTSALGVMARLSFLEGQEAAKSEAGDDAVILPGMKALADAPVLEHRDLEKAGKRLSAQSVAALTASRDHITELLGQDDPSIIPADQSAQQEDILDMTKDELIELLDEREAAKAVKEDVAVEEVAESTDDEAAKAADDESTEIEAEADPAEAAKSEAATKSEVESVKEAIENLGKTIESAVGVFDNLKDRLETVEKMAAPGGPVKTRTTDQTKKSAERDLHELEAAHYEEMAKETSDADLRLGYAAKAAEARAAAAAA